MGDRIYTDELAFTAGVWENFISRSRPIWPYKDLGDWMLMVHAELTTHGGRIAYDASARPYIKFNTDAEQTAFLLKWG